MKIALISPFHRSGLSTVTTLLGLTLTWTQLVSTVISYTGESNIPKMLGTTTIDDKTRSISQLSKLLAERAIGPEQILEYCVPLAKDLHLLDTTSTILTDNEKEHILSFVFDQVPTDFVVCECTGNLEDAITQSVLSVADIIIMVFEPYGTQFDGVSEYLNDKNWPKDKHTMLLCNKYDNIVMPLRTISSRFGIKHVNMCKLHYNPWVMRMGESGNLADILDPILTKDPRVVELNNDMREWMDFFMSLKNTRVRWGG